MTLPTGNWAMDISGSPATLLIQSIESGGTVVGNLTRGPSTYDIVGQWDETAKQLVFHTRGPMVSVVVLAFTEYLFRDTFRMPNMNGSVNYTRRFVHFFGGNEGTPDQHEFGWYAQISLA